MTDGEPGGTGGNSLFTGNDDGVLVQALASRQRMTRIAETELIIIFCFSCMIRDRIKYVIMLALTAIIFALIAFYAGNAVFLHGIPALRPAHSPLRITWDIAHRAAAGRK
jgi:hypothetical protein